MSEKTCYDLEGFLRWYYDVDPTAVPGFMGLFEPFREFIENGLDNFNDEEQSWRSYGSCLGDYFEGATDLKARELLKKHYENPTDPGKDDDVSLLRQGRVIDDSTSFNDRAQCSTG